MRRTLFWSFALVLAATPLIASANPSLLTAPSAIVLAQQGVEKLPAENIDGSKVNAKIQNQAVEIIKEFRAAADLRVAADDALAKFDKLYEQDQKNLSVLTWIGYLSSVTGDHARAIETLESIRGKSSVTEVNAMNLRNLAASYYTTANYSGAQSALVELDSLEPGNAETLSLLGNAYLLDEKYSQAIEPLRKAVALLEDDPDSIRKVQVDLGIAYYRANQHANAMQTFDALRGDSGLTAGQLSWMGYVYMENDRLDPAIECLERSVELDTTNEIAVTNLANCYLKRNRDGDQAKAATLYADMGTTGGNPVADYNVGSLYLSRGEYQQALPYLQRAAENSDPYALNNLALCYEGLKDDSQAAPLYARASDARRDEEIYARNAGFAYMRLKNHHAAIPYLERAMQLGGNNVNRDVAANLATAYSHVGRVDDATKLWMNPAVRDHYKSDATYWFNLGKIHADQGHTAEAESAYRQSLSIEPNNPAALNNLGVLLWDRGDYSGALDCFQKQSTAEPASIEAKLNVASAHVRLEQLDKAVEIWREVVRSNPENDKVRLDLADGLWNLGDTPGARFHYAYVNRLQPTNARALNGLGMWALLQTEHDEAESLFRQAIKADRSYIPAFQNLAVVLERKNRVRDAIVVLEAALAMDSSNDGVREQLARLKSG